MTMYLPTAAAVLLWLLSAAAAFFIGRYLPAATKRDAVTETQSHGGMPSEKHRAHSGPEFLAPTVTEGFANMATGGALERSRRKRGFGG